MSAVQPSLQELHLHWDFPEKNDKAPDYRIVSMIFWVPDFCSITKIIEPLFVPNFVLCSSKFGILLVKVRKFQNENMKSSHFPKYEQKSLKNSALSVQGRMFQIFCSYFG